MIETIRYSEYEYFLWLNSFHTPFFDTLMYWITYRFTWIPLYLFIIYYLFTKNKVIFWQNLLFVITSVALADRITSGFMKPYFHRLRPCHDVAIQHIVHVVGDCGGQFGFASSHAANSFALAISLLIISKKLELSNKLLLIFLFFWAIIVSYSRIYVGVHFPSDILIGGLIGSLVPFIIKPIWLHFYNKTYFNNL